jgi:hypothetical protein
MHLKQHAKPIKEQAQAEITKIKLQRIPISAHYMPSPTENHRIVQVCSIRHHLSITEAVLQLGT